MSAVSELGVLAARLQIKTAVATALPGATLRKQPTWEMPPELPKIPAAPPVMPALGGVTTPPRGSKPLRTRESLAQVGDQLRQSWSLFSIDAPGSLQRPARAVSNRGLSLQPPASWKPPPVPKPIPAPVDKDYEAEQLRRQGEIEASKRRDEFNRNLVRNTPNPADVRRMHASEDKRLGVLRDRQNAEYSRQLDWGAPTPESSEWEALLSIFSIPEHIPPSVLADLTERGDRSEAEKLRQRDQLQDFHKHERRRALGLN